jgi:SAM-dependent methyltransferase
MEQDWIEQHRRRLFGKWLKPGETVLEFGARDIWNLRALEAAEKYVCAPRAEKALFEKEGIKLFDTSTALPDACVDLVICDAVLEYLQQPINEILELKRALRPNGVMVVHVLYDPDFRRPRFDRPVEHYFSWNVQTLGNLLVDCGLEFVEGSVRRMPHENEVTRLGKRFGFPLAEVYSKLGHPHRQVCVAARQPSQPSSR